LGNLVADLSLEIANDLYIPSDNDSIDFCLLNFGGLRTSLPKGEITRGKIFELMPFENELVVVTIENKQMAKLIKYLYVNPQPISKGITLSSYEIYDGASLQNGLSTTENKYRLNKEFKILTSDYLANGGDKMNFFLDPINIEPVGIKLRDAIIQYCISENKKGNKLLSNLDGRITFE
ncbi:MAG: 5'-nucleotidase, partial [Vicingaceae bacterium]